MGTMRLLVDSAIVGAGGFAGSVCRYLLSMGLGPHAPGFPAGTLAANVGGCFIIGLLGQFAMAGGYLTPATRLLLATGFCGGFTTASTLIYETAEMLREGAAARAGLYLGVTLAGCFLAYYAGMVAARIIRGGGVWN